MTIETDRLILRQFTEEDYMAVYAYGSNDEVSKYTGDPNLETPEEALDIIRNVIHADYSNHGYGRLAVCISLKTR
jgi:[ribosomal protein S5]-alanine N-acetyltransferase